MKKFLSCFLVAVILFAPSAYPSGVGNLARATMGYVPEPRLLNPMDETVDLSAREELQFKWSIHEARNLGGGRRYYEFRLYKGSEMLESTLIFKENIHGDRDSAVLDSGIFEDGAVYTWSLKQCYKGVGKSKRSFHSFKVIK